MKTYNFREIRPALGAGQSVLIPIPLVMTLVAIHGVALGRRLRLLRAGPGLSSRLIHGMEMLMKTPAGVAESIK